MAMGPEWFPNAPLFGTAHAYNLSCDRHPDLAIAGDDHEDALVRLRQRVPPMG